MPSTPCPPACRRWAGRAPRQRLRGWPRRWPRSRRRCPSTPGSAARSRRGRDPSRCRTPILANTSPRAVTAWALSASACALAGISLGTSPRKSFPRAPRSPPRADRCCRASRRRGRRSAASPNLEELAALRGGTRGWRRSCTTVPRSSVATSVPRGRSSSSGCSAVSTWGFSASSAALFFGRRLVHRRAPPSPARAGCRRPRRARRTPSPPRTRAPAQSPRPNHVSISACTRSGLSLGQPRRPRPRASAASPGASSRPRTVQRSLPPLTLGAAFAVGEKAYAAARPPSPPFNPPSPMPMVTMGSPSALQANWLE